MTGGTKVINRSLTIISLMVMIAAGSLVITIPEASAEGTQIVFNIEPVVNDVIVPDCEAIVYCADDLELYITFQPDDEGVIAIDSDSFLWDWEESPEIIIEVYENTNTKVFTPIRTEIGIGTIDTTITICGTVASDTTTQKTFVYTMQMKNKDQNSITMIHTRKKGGNSINVLPLTANGKIYFYCIYSSHFATDTKPCEKGYAYRFKLDFGFTVKHTYIQGGSNPTPVITQSHLAQYYEVPEIDNTVYDEEIQGYLWDKDSHYDPVFSSNINAHLYIKGYYRVTLTCDWEIDRRTAGYPEFSLWNYGSDSNYYDILITYE